MICSADNTIPTIATILPAFTLPKDFAVYARGLALYNSLALFAITKAIIPNISPLPQAQQKGMDKIPNTKISVAFGNSC